MGDEATTTTRTRGWRRTRRWRPLERCCLSLSSGLPPIPPPCRVGGSEASWMLLGVSWLPTWGPREAVSRPLQASWGHSGGLFGPLWGLLGPLWGLLGLQGVVSRAYVVSCGLSGPSRGGSKARILVRGVQKSRSRGPRIHLCILAFGICRHRAWIVGVRPLRCSLGSFGTWEASLWPS